MRNRCLFLFSSPYLLETDGWMAKYYHNTVASRVLSLSGSPNDELPWETSAKWPDTDDSEDLDEGEQTIHYRKYKKRSYHILHDIQERIQRRDSNLVAKAAEAVTEIQAFGYPLLETKAQNMYMQALSIDGRPYDAEQVLQSLAQPTERSYGIVLDAYARQGRAKDAERLLLQAMDYNLAATIHFDTVLKAYAQQETLPAAQQAHTILENWQEASTGRFRPTAVSYTTVLTAWANCRGGVPAAQQAQQVWHQAQLHVHVDMAMGNMVLQAWSKCGQAEKALDLLHGFEETSVEELQPDVASYNICLSAVARSNLPQRAARTQSVLQRMIRRHQEGKGPAATVYSYNAVLQAYEDDDPERSEQLLQLLLQSPRLSPDGHSFGICINNWKRSKKRGKSSRAFSLLQLWMESTPQHTWTPVPFNAVLNAAAFDKASPKAFQVLQNTWKLLHMGYPRPDSLSYGIYLKALRYLRPRQARTMAQDAWDQACHQGLVTPMVQQQAKYFVQVPAAAAAKLPKAWTRHGQQQWTKGRQVQHQEEVKKEKEEKESTRFASLPVTETITQSGRDL